jgi:hypothetical protein
MASILATSASEVRADPMADAKDLFTRGRELRVRGDCAHAVDLFRKAYELYPAALGSLRNEAECDESLGRFASARRAWVDLKRALLTNREPKYDGWEQDADQAAARLAPKLATLTIDMNIVAPGGEAAASPTDGVDVTLDGERLAPALIGTPLERDSGRHVVRVAGERVTQPLERAIDLAPGDTKRVALRVVVDDAKAGSANPDAAPLAAAPASRREGPRDAGAAPGAAQRTLGWVALGVGVAALAGAGASLGVRQSALDDLNAECPSHRGCPDSVRSIEDRGRAAGVLFPVLGIAGVVAAGAGAVLLVTAPAQAAAHARLTLTPSLGGLAVGWRY